MTGKTNNNELSEKDDISKIVFEELNESDEEEPLNNPINPINEEEKKDEKKDGSSQK